jgi:hypothetical protein
MRDERKTGIPRLWELASRKRALVVCSCVLAVASVAAFTMLYELKLDFTRHIF